ncbi:MAG: hypothetical protein XU09_C0004G0123 [Thaumarchaeota archaeon CSP1-1]|jgi:hypothetical protein|nr:MAG: hypothetical protein XU09_C0004G0123 [Thaumarchaeota archaeon CSP1-1]
MGKFKEKGYFIQSLAAISIVMLGIGGVQSASAGLDDGQINLEARLNQDYGDGSGKAMFVAQDYRVRLSIEIENMSMNCESFSAKMSGVEVVGYFEYNNGVCNLNLDTRQGDTVPAVAAGDEVYVFGNGVTLTGILHFK